MNQLTEASPLELVYAPIADELRAVEDILRREMRSDFPFVDELVRYGCLLGGKRLRPALLLLTGKAVGAIHEDHLVLAAVIEMIHTATLVHDDILDDADMRRHLATVNSRWDNQSAVLLGDFLFTHAFYLSSTRDSTWACREIGRATNIVCEGELRQKGCRGDFALSERDYLEIIAAKTAELCACSCRIGAYYAGGDSRTVERLTQFGRDLGIAFQIVDDVLDLQGDEAATGKSLGTDLEQQKPTLPIIHALAAASPADRDELLRLVAADGPRAPARLAAILRRHDSIRYALDQARRFVGRGIDALAHLKPSPAVQTLQQLAAFIVDRTR